MQSEIITGVRRLRFGLFIGALLTTSCLGAAQQPALRIQSISCAPEPCLSIQSTVGVTNVIEYTEVLGNPSWRPLTNLVTVSNFYLFVDSSTSRPLQRYYRVTVPSLCEAPQGMLLIPAGEFTMGDAFHEGWGDELPVHTVSVSAFYMDRFEVTKVLWDEVKTWALTNGYRFDYEGSGKTAHHPVHTLNWFDAVKWCNARSEMQGRLPAYYLDAAQTEVYRAGQVHVQNDWVNWSEGYRLPTEAEWEKAARGGASGHRFPWATGDTITHGQANYCSLAEYLYDISPTQGYHSSYNDGTYPYTNPVGAFEANPYGLSDLAGNVWEWCWDWYGRYREDSSLNPVGPATGWFRVLRGGCWINSARHCRVSYRYYLYPTNGYYFYGFRSVLPFNP